MAGMVRLVDCLFTVKPGADVLAAVDRPFRLYLHIPWCKQICAFCALPRELLAESGQLTEYTTALVEQIRVARSRLTAAPKEVYFGGGTPALLTAAQLEQIMAEVQRFPLPPGAPVTLEARTCDLEPDFLSACQSAGITRVSVGVQSLCDAERRLWGLRGSVEQVLQCLSRLAAGGFQVNFDLIYGGAGQLLEPWRETLRQCLELRPQQISAFPCMRLAGTRIATPSNAAPPCNSRWTIYQMVQVLLEETRRAGYYQSDPFMFTRRDLPSSVKPYRDHDSETPILGLGSSGSTSILPGMLAVNPYTTAAYCAALNDHPDLELLVIGNRLAVWGFQTTLRLFGGLTPPLAAQPTRQPNAGETLRAFLVAQVWAKIYAAIRDWMTLTSRVGFTTTEQTRHLVKDAHYRGQSALHP